MSTRVDQLLAKASVEIAGFVGVVMTPVNLLRFSDITARLLTASPTVPFRTAVYQSSIHLLDSQPEHTVLVETVRRLAANTRFLKQGVSVPTWRGELVEVHIGISGVTRKRLRRYEALEFYFRVLSGLPAGQLYSYTLPCNYVSRLMDRKLGVDKFDSMYPENIAGTQCTITMLRDNEGRIHWKEVCANDREKQFNERLNNERRNKRCNRARYCAKCRCVRTQCRYAVH